MFGGSSTFYAGLAGARADDIVVLERDRDQWQQHAQAQEARANHLEQQVGRLQIVLGQWQDEAVEAHAFNDVHKAAYQEETGQKLRERIGDEEMDRRITEARQVARKDLLGR